LLIVGLLTLAAIAGVFYMEKKTGSVSFLKWEPVPSALYDSWNDYKQTYGKTYGHDAEYFRFNIYKKNVIFIHDHNKQHEAGLETFTVGSN